MGFGLWQEFAGQIVDFGQLPAAQRVRWCEGCIFVSLTRIDAPGALELQYDRHAHAGVLRVLFDNIGSSGLFGSRSGIAFGRRAEMT